jgi:hypothetical protein
MSLLDPEDLRRLRPAETHSYPGPLPTQSVSSDEFMPYRQTAAQRRVEARTKELGSALARRHRMTGRQFFQTASGMAAAFLVSQLVKGLGADHVVWGSDAIWTGSPQWQIEALRRLEIPEVMQKKYGFQPRGPADGPVESAILGETNARLYKYTKEWRAALPGDRLAALRREYEQGGTNRSNPRYGYVLKSRA